MDDGVQRTALGLRHGARCAERDCKRRCSQAQGTASCLKNLHSLFSLSVPQPEPPRCLPRRNSVAPGTRQVAGPIFAHWSSQKYFPAATYGQKLGVRTDPLLRSAGSDGARRGPTRTARRDDSPAVNSSIRGRYPALRFTTRPAFRNISTAPLREGNLKAGSHFIISLQRIETPRAPLSGPRRAPIAMPRPRAQPAQSEAAEQAEIGQAHDAPGVSTSSDHGRVRIAWTREALRNSRGKTDPMDA